MFFVFVSMFVFDDPTNDHEKSKLSRRVVLPLSSYCGEFIRHDSAGRVCLRLIVRTYVGYSRRVSLREMS